MIFRTRPTLASRVFVPMLLLIAPQVVGASEAGNAIRGVFSAYRSAILEGKGDDAANLLSQSTLDYFDEMRRLSLDGDAATIQSHALVDQIQIMLFRLRVPVKILETLSARGLLAYSIEQGWIGKESVAKVTPGKVQSEAEAALLHVDVDGRDAGPAFRFYLEASGWRLDLVPTLKATDAILRSAALREGVSHSEYVLAVMSKALEKTVGVEAWKPLRESSPSK